jgi:dienelactone hydrolase
LLVEPLASLPSVVVIFFGMSLALMLAIVGATMRLRRNLRRRAPVLRPGKQVDLGPMQAFFYQPVGDGPAPGLCLLPDPTAPQDDLDELVQALVESGIAVLLLDWQSLGSADRLMLQGLVAVGISHLARWPEINSARVGLLGVGVGGDLALRSAAMDQGVVAVLAIEPVLSVQRPWQGLEALTTLSWFEARRRVLRWRRSELVKELDALTAIPGVAPRPAAVIVGCMGESEIVEDFQVLRDEGGCFLVPAARMGAVQRATEWFKEHLA